MQIAQLQQAERQLEMPHGAAHDVQHPSSSARLVDFAGKFEHRFEVAHSHSSGARWVAGSPRCSPTRAPTASTASWSAAAGGAATRPLPMMTALEPPTLEQARAALADRTDVDEALLDQWAELGWRNVQQIAEPVPAAELVVHDCGHCTPAERPAEFNAVVSLFLGGSAASTS